MERNYASDENHQIICVADGRTHRLRVSRGSQHDPGSPERGQLGGNIGDRAIYITLGTELLGQRRLTFTSRDRDGSKSRPRSELHGQVAQATDALNGDQISRTAAAQHRDQLRQ